MGVETVASGERQVSKEAEATETERANQLFLERIRCVPGVVHVEPFGGQSIGEQSFRVYVRNGDLAAEYGVYDVTGEVYDQHPEARLVVEVLEESDLPKDAAGIAATSS